CGRGGGYTIAYFNALDVW
nr:immunoglobulin heavy chain junction region [Macaca mulatta]